MTSRPKFTRRSALGVGGGAIGAAVLTACGGSESDGADGGSSGSGTESTTPSPKSGEQIAAVSDVPVGGSTEVEVNGEKVLLSQPKKGEIKAFSSVCTHQGCAVKPDGPELHCPCHNSIFDAATGDVVGGPAPEPLPSVPVKVNGDKIVAT